MSLTNEEKRILMDAARRTVAALATEGARLTVADFGVDSIPSTLGDERGAFVSLHRFGQLRGCIGNIAPLGTLLESVIRNAINAAAEDPRFQPVRADELDELEIEISVLTPLEEIHGPDDLVIGRDGLYLTAHGHSGVLLPQVATEQRWDAAEFIRRTAIKAGMDPARWKSARLFRFAAEVFSEKSLEE